MFAAHAVANFRTKSRTRVIDLLVLVIRRMSRQSPPQTGRDIRRGALGFADPQANGVESPFQNRVRLIATPPCKSIFSNLSFRARLR
jgi:hypothetical protein